MRKILSVTLFFILALSAFGQVGKQTDLYKTILSKDNLLFNVGFNTCDIKQFENLLSEKFEFYQDKDGVSDKNKFLNDLRNGLCSNPANYQARRELISESTEVYGLNNKTGLYGAIQNGVHQFFEKQGNRPEKFGSSAKFTHLWLLENGEWKLAKSYSYEHQNKLLSSATPIQFEGKQETLMHESIGLETSKVFDKLVKIRRNF